MLTATKNLFRSSYLLLAASKVGPFPLRGQPHTFASAVQHRERKTASPWNSSANRSGCKAALPKLHSADLGRT